MLRCSYRNLRYGYFRGSGDQMFSCPERPPQNSREMAPLHINPRRVASVLSPSPPHPSILIPVSSLPPLRPLSYIFNAIDPQTKLTTSSSTSTSSVSNLPSSKFGFCRRFAQLRHQVSPGSRSGNCFNATITFLIRYKHALSRSLYPGSCSCLH